MDDLLETQRKLNERKAVLQASVSMNGVNGMTVKGTNGRIIPARPSHPLHCFVQVCELKAERQGTEGAVIDMGHKV